MPTEIFPGDRLIGRIPVRNLWLLMLYASDVTRFRGEFDAHVEDDVDELPDLVARLLSDSIERRLRRNLTRGFRRREAAIRRVRGRIDILKTETRQLLSRGQVFCRFEELTNDTPRNRFIRAALDLMVWLVRDDQLRQRCRALSCTLARAGVGVGRPARTDLASDQIGRNDSADRFMVALARLAFELALPTEDSGATSLVAPDREETLWVRRLFEKAVLGFARVELAPLRWKVRGGIRLNWRQSSESKGLSAILPAMRADIVLDPPGCRRVVVDTKFASLLTVNQFDKDRLKSGYLYQMYTYLRSQEGHSPRWEGAAGLFLHPAIGARFYEHAVIQNHPITFATIDLTSSATNIRNELREILLGQRQAHPQID